MASVRKRTWKTASGEAKAAWVVDYTDNHGDRQRKHFSNKKAADAFRIQVEGQMQVGTYRPNANKVTVKEVCESFLERLRHFAVSCWIDAGLAPKTVQTFAGHASLQVTMDRYGHLFPSEDHQKAMNQIAKGLFA